MTTTNDQLITELRLLRRTIAQAAVFIGLNAAQPHERSDVELRVLSKTMNALADAGLLTNPQELADQWEPMEKLT